MSGDRFVYVTYIRTTPERLWTALTDPDFTQRYWFGMRLESNWGKGASWSLANQAGTVMDIGKVLEIDRPRRLVLSWHHQWREEFEGRGRCPRHVHAGAARRAGEADSCARKSARRLEGDRSSLRRLAAGAVEPEVLARDRQRTAPPATGAGLRRLIPIRNIIWRRHGLRR